MRTLQDQRFVFGLPYYSTVRFQFERTGAGPYVYTLARNPVRAFSYGEGQTDCTAAGFPTGYTATHAETNLLEKQQTNASEEVEITALGCLIEPGSDARMAALVCRNVFCELSLNGDQQLYRLGTIPMLPGGGGLMGGGVDDAGTQPIPGGRPSYSFVSNGWPAVKNDKRLPGGIVWRNKAKRDSMLSVIFTPASVKVSSRTISYTTEIGNEAAAAGVRGYTFPAGPLNVDVRVVLYGVVYGERSRVT